MSGIAVPACTQGDAAVVDGRRVLLGSDAGLRPLLEALNSSLEDGGDVGRFYSLDTESDSYLIVCRNASVETEIAKHSFFRLA